VRFCAVAELPPMTQSKAAMASHEKGLEVMR
jgi:hypothetical protein